MSRQIARGNLMTPSCHSKQPTTVVTHNIKAFAVETRPEQLFLKRDVNVFASAKLHNMAVVFGAGVR